MAGIARFASVALDCAEPRRLAEFYAAVIGGTIVKDREDWVEVSAGDGVTLAFQLAPNHRPPTWPSDEHPQQLHIDLEVDDLDEGERAVLALGARKAEIQPDPDWRVFLDPSGHPFCLVPPE
jgi:catechol 2,3-dioxygenase-like lactoylglutathione lyase family enzyme